MRFKEIKLITVPTVTKFSEEPSVSCVYVACKAFFPTKDDVYVLIFSGGEWVFRQYTNLRYGHSRGHEHMRAAIERVLQRPDDKVLQFHDWYHMCEWVATLD